MTNIYEFLAVAAFVLSLCAAALVLAMRRKIAERERISAETSKHLARAQEAWVEGLNQAPAGGIRAWEDSINQYESRLRAGSCP